jgi:hypothetical protein
MDPAPPAAPPHAPVNPLGGTMVADSAMGGFNPYGQPNPYGAPPAAPADPYGPPPAPGGYGTPGPAPAGYGQPQGGGYGAPAPAAQQPSFGGAVPPGGGYGQAPAQPGYGQPQAGYGQPQGGYGQPQAGYGQPQAGYGQPQGGYGAPGGFNPPQDQYGMPGGGAPMVAMGSGQRGPIGKIRNPVMSIVFSLISCGIYPMVAAYLMANELNAFRGQQVLNPIMFFVPIMNWIEGFKLSALVLETKQMTGVPNPTVVHQVLYGLWPTFFMPADLNEIWQAASGGQYPPG